MKICILIVGASLLGVSSSAAAQQTLSQAQITRIDSIFARYARPDSPGCALGVSRADAIVFERGWGSANLEHPVPITPNTIFEAGSVSKQFTAAAVLRLAQQGKLSLDADVRTIVPEVRRYDTPITIRHLIHHTSGLRDWGTIMGFAFWPRGTRTYTHAHVLDIISRQRELNFRPGAEYLYSNSNYNLLAIIAERVSGKSLAEFTRTEFFEPLGMTRTGWRDDYTRIVPGRAQAYRSASDGWHLQMPFENVYGNSSLLTTVGDLLRWNFNFTSQRVGGAELVNAQLRRGQLSNGREITYAAGLVVGEWEGAPEVSHDGATAGYVSFLGRYPAAGYGIALLCNSSAANPTVLGQAVATVLMPPPARPAVTRDTVGLPVSAPDLTALARIYRSSRSSDPLSLVADNGRLRLAGGPFLVGTARRRFISPSGRTQFIFQPDTGEVHRVLLVVENDTNSFVPAGSPPAAPALPEYAGTYVSEEADVSVTLALENGQLFLSARPATKLPLTPLYHDGFSAQGAILSFTRTRTGVIDGFQLSQGRARNVKYERVRTAGR